MKTTPSQPAGLPREDLILAALVAGPLSVAELVERTGLIARRVQRGLHHLIAANYVVSPAWGTYRLTGRGEAACPGTAARVRPAPATPRPLDRVI